MKTTLQPVAGGYKSMPRHGNEQYRAQGPVRVQPMLQHLPIRHAPGVQLADVVGYSAPPLSPAARTSLLVNAIDGSAVKKLKLDYDLEISRNTEKEVGTCARTTPFVRKLKSEEIVAQKEGFLRLTKQATPTTSLARSRSEDNGAIEPKVENGDPVYGGAIASVLAAE
ncbi:hypothetical protein U1Q18_043598 [Sarracenia purpurea var. burkii]